MTEPIATELDVRFSGSEARATPWDTARDALTDARIYWITTVRHDLRPHVTPLIGLFIGDAFYFCTGPDEQKARNLAANPHCTLTTGCHLYSQGLDVMIDGEAVRIRDDRALQAVADEFEAVYGSDWHFDVRDGEFHHDGGSAHVFRVEPVTAHSYRRGEFSQTRHRFAGA